jgi:hypothetical protein
MVSVIVKNADDSPSVSIEMRQISLPVKPLFWADPACLLIHTSPGSSSGTGTPRTKRTACGNRDLSGTFGIGILRAAERLLHSCPPRITLGGV